VIKSHSLALAAVLLAAPLAAQAGNKGNAVVGSVIGGAAGAIIGNSLGGRDGAIVGGAIGAAAGVTIATDQQRYGGYPNQYDNRRDHYGHSGQYRQEVVVVESPRHYYQGNEFVYGVPPRRNAYNDHDHHHGHNRHHGQRYQQPEVIIIQPAPQAYYNRPYYSQRRW
jgi:hypothetical protein